MRVQDMMIRSVAFCVPEDSLGRAAQLMWERDCGTIPVVGRGGEVVGIVTDRDVCMAAHFTGRRLLDIPVSEVMSRVVHVCGPADSIESAEAIMRNNQVRRLPVVDEFRRLVAILSMADIARHTRPTVMQPAHALPLLVETLARISEPRARPN